MNKEYYTPEISDLKIGYECEICTNYGYESFNEGEEKWEKVIIGYKIPGGYNDELCDIIHGLDDGYQPVRVKYLTREQIEKEGWKIEPCFITKLKFTKDKICLDYYPHAHKLEIYLWKETKLFDGVCPSINEFRTIINLLNI